MHFPFITLFKWYDITSKRQYNRQNTNIEKCIHVYACERSERAEKILAFSHSKNCYFLQYFCWYCRQFVSETYLNSGVNNICIHIQSQFPFITYGMVLYINDSTPTNTNMRKCIFGIFHS